MIQPSRFADIVYRWEQAQNFYKRGVTKMPTNGYDLINVVNDRNVEDIKIVKAMNGFIVGVGCKTVVFESQEKMMTELNRYLSDPETVKKEYLDKYKGA